MYIGYPVKTTRRKFQKKLFFEQKNLLLKSYVRGKKKREAALPAPMYIGLLQIIKFFRADKRSMHRGIFCRF